MAAGGGGQFCQMEIKQAVCTLSVVSSSILKLWVPIFDALSTGEENGQGLGCPEADHIEVAGHDAGWSHTCRGHE